MPINANTENEKQGDDQNDYEIDDNLEEPIIRAEDKGKGKGKGKNSNRAPKTSIEL